jgi:HK97 family phage prohead protease
MEISGYAALFNTETTIANLFRERIELGAFSETLARDDIRALFNHNPDLLLGRTTARTLTLREDPQGLHYTVRLNDDDPAATSVAAKIARRDVTGSSFWFAVDSPDDETWTRDDSKRLPLRTLKIATHRRFTRRFPSVRADAGRCAWHGRESRASA